MPRVVVAGPAAWNHLIVLDRLPEPTPHMQFAEASVHTVGGTSAGKALHLHALGVDSRLHALLGDDADGRRVAAALRGAGVDLVAHTAGTERHVNLMTRAGGRVSLYVSTPDAARPEVLAAIDVDLAGADVAVLDLSAVGADLLPRLPASVPLWTDLHDYDGAAAFHEPFLRRAEVVFMNADRTDDPWGLLASCIARGPRLAVCTLGADGAIALDRDGRRTAVPADQAEVVDTNGAGDAFFAGVLAAVLDAGGLANADLTAALRAGAAQAVTALATVHLHPALAAAEGTTT